MSQRTREEITRDILECQVRSDLIKGQLLEAKGRAAETGEYSDHDWFVRAQSALRGYGRRRLALQAELTALKGQAREQHESGANLRRQLREARVADPWWLVFHKMAERMLEDETFAMIERATNREMGRPRLDEVLP